MDQRAQSFLAGKLDAARARDGWTEDGDENVVGNILRSFQAAVEAFRSIGLVSPDEEHDWYNRMLAAVGREPLPPLRGPGHARIVNLAGSGQAPRHEPAPPAEFKRQIAIASAVKDVPYGGRLQVLSVELYDSQLAVSWRIAPLPNPEAMFSADLAAHERDTEGLSAEQRDELRTRLMFGLRRRYVHGIRLTDDTAAAYFRSGGSASGGSSELTGRAVFSPAPLPGATQLVVHFDALSSDIPVSLS